ncbi:MAG: hypothetical protein OEZ59_02750 [Deltaproteobacteria bacterium]|nr:hypothetical protein [Deltaproteobacteria bacterium]
MDWILTIPLCILLVELFLRLPLARKAAQVSRTAHKAVRIIASGSISDHWKEKAVPAYARRVFMGTMVLTGYMLLIGIAAYGVIVLFDYFSGSFGMFISSLEGIVLSTIVATGYYFVSKRLVWFKLRSS